MPIKAASGKVSGRCLLEDMSPNRSTRPKSMSRTRWPTDSFLHRLADESAEALPSMKFSGFTSMNRLPFSCMARMQSNIATGTSPNGIFAMPLALQCDSRRIGTTSESGAAILSMTRNRKSGKPTTQCEKSTLGRLQQRQRIKLALGGEKEKIRLTLIRSLPIRRWVAREAYLRHHFPAHLIPRVLQRGVLVKD